MIVMSVGNTAAPIVAVAKAAGAAADFFAVIDAPTPSTDGLKDPQIAHGDIAFESVTFAYPSRPHVRVLDNLSVRFPAGKLTAIVGASGSGKSTIVGLLERWYGLDAKQITNIPVSRVKTNFSEKVQLPEDTEGPKDPIPLSGSITLGGHDLQEIDLTFLRAQIGLVQQEPFLFNDSIFKNVEHDLVGTQWEDEDEKTKRTLVEEACKEAFADEFINRLPQVSQSSTTTAIVPPLEILTYGQGYDTQVGDAGIKLSGGQRQRLAIARSIIKRPKILILDEATSAIDVRGEQIVQAALDKVSKDRTTITIAHRLSTIKKADNIVVVRRGKVVEQGSHESLLADSDGAYWALVNAQKLSMGEVHAEESDLVEESSMDPLVRQQSSGAGGAVVGPQEDLYQPRGLVRSFGLLLLEQKSHWAWYAILLLATMGAGGKLSHLLIHSCTLATPFSGCFDDFCRY